MFWRIKKHNYIWSYRCLIFTNLNFNERKTYSKRCLIASLLFIYLPTLTATFMCKDVSTLLAKISALNSYYNVNISHMNPKCLSLWSARTNFSKWSLHPSAFYIFYEMLVYFHFDWTLSSELEIHILKVYLEFAYFIEVENFFIKIL